MRGRYGVSPLEGVAEDAVVESGETTIRPYKEEDPISPVGVYGKTKASG